MRVLTQRKGFAALEYAIVFVCLVVALLYMACYLRRGIQGSLKGVQDDISTRMYLPRQMDSKVTTRLEGKAKFGSGENIGAVTYYWFEDDASGEENYKVVTTNTITHTLKTEEGDERVLR